MPDSHATAEAEPITVRISLKDINALYTTEPDTLVSVPREHVQKAFDLRVRNLTAEVSAKLPGAAIFIEIAEVCRRRAYDRGNFLDYAETIFRVTWRNGDRSSEAEFTLGSLGGSLRESVENLDWQTVVNAVLAASGTYQRNSSAHRFAKKINKYFD